MALGAATDVDGAEEAAGAESGSRDLYETKNRSPCLKVGVRLVVKVGGLAEMRT